MGSRSRAILVVIVGFVGCFWVGVVVQEAARDLGHAGDIVLRRMPSRSRAVDQRGQGAIGVGVGAAEVVAVKFASDNGNIVR